MSIEFLGFRRADGRVGTRNTVAVISTVVCANEVAQDIASRVDGAVAFTHHQGCGRTQPDIKRTNMVLANLGRNPNVAAVLLVSLGCESTVLEEVAAGIQAAGKRVEIVTIQKEGGAARTLAKGTLIAQGMVMEASTLKREPFPISELVLGLKCGGSDTTQGLSANPALGLVSDRLIAEGGTSILGEVTEFIGAEHILARHARDDQVAAGILGLVERMEGRAKAVGCDMRGGQPTKGNILGGLTTIEEKSLGAIAKAGTAPVEAVYEYGVVPDRKGLVVMDSPGREPELLTGLASAGCNIIVFTTGRGAPQGFPLVPVIKVTGNAHTFEHMNDHMDLCVAEVIDGGESLTDAAGRIFEKLLQTASGAWTKAESSGYTRAMDIFMTGPLI